MGQKCEDFLTNIIFKNKPGVFIDVGAHDGVRFSNSYSYSQIGWKGICIEAHPDYYDLCKKIVKTVIQGYSTLVII